MAQNVSWQEELRTKISSRRSPVSFVCTSDNHRFMELLGVLDTLKDLSGNEVSERVYVFDAWRGLSEYNKDKDDIEPVAIPPAEDVLEHLFALLAENGTNIILKNFDTNFFLRFLIYLSTSFGLSKKHSNLVALVDSVEDVPDSLIERANIIDVVTLPQEREKVVVDTLEGCKLKGEDPVQISRVLRGLNLDQTEASIVGSKSRFLGINMGYLQQVKREAIARKGNLTLYESTRGFESIGGYGYARDFVSDFVVLPLKYPDIAKAMGVELPKGLLMFGIEGTGKTCFTKAMGKELNMPVVEFHLGALKGKYVGETEQMTQSAIKGIKEISPCIVLVDEIEHAGFRPSGEGDSGTSLNQFTMMLTFMSENHGSILVGTTNQIDKLDPAFMRAGRLDYYIPMMLPDSDARRAIWDVHTKVVRQVPLAKDVDVAEVVKRSEWYNGAEIELLVQTASKLALKDFVRGGKKGEKVVKMEHVIQAFAERKVDVEDRKKRTAAHKARAEQLCPQGIMKAAFGQDVDVQKNAMSEVMGDYRRDVQ